jgi:23S rRNA pseudouridine1911/1915/1917 synthase
MPQEKIVVQPEETGERIDTFLARKTGITRSQIQKLIEEGDVLVNEKPVNQHYRVKMQDVINIRITQQKTDELVPEPIPVDILYKDNHLVVVNKPAGMVVYPGRRPRP